MHDRDGLTKLAACAEHEVPIIWAAAPNAGSTGPRSIAGTAVVGNAETLAGLVYRRRIRSGAPFVSAWARPPWTCAPRSTPTPPPRARWSGRARRPLSLVRTAQAFNYASMSDSKTLDEQFALEYGLTAMAGALPRGTLIHDVGYLESGLQDSCESIVFGNAAIGWAKAFMADVPTTDEALAVGEITAVSRAATSAGSQVHRRPLARLLVRRPLRPLGLRPLARGRAPDHARQDQGQVAELRATRAFVADPAMLANVAEIMQAAGREREA